MSQHQQWISLVLIGLFLIVPGCGGDPSEKIAEKPGEKQAGEKQAARIDSSPGQASGGQKQVTETHETENTSGKQSIQTPDMGATNSVAGPVAKIETSKGPVSPMPSVPGTEVPAVKANQEPVRIVKPDAALLARNKIDPNVQQRVQKLGENLKLGAQQGIGLENRNHFKQIALAFHNFHETLGHFPAPNGIGEKDVPHPGLSWRVYLLPYLEQGALYNEFHHDEPWDSEHNKTLIARMPQFFGVSDEGKTSVHVFTGKNAPFQNDQGLRFADVIDGTSKTILCVAAGDDKAEVWTKPGGLEFDSTDPQKCLGDIGELFLVSMMDGSVRIIKKSIAPEQLGYLIQHADQKVIDQAAARGHGGQSEQTIAKIPRPVTPLEPESPQFDISFIPADTFAVLAIHPRRILAHPVLKVFQSKLDSERLSNQGPLDLFRIFNQADHFGNMIGVSPLGLDEMVIMLDKTLLESAVNGFRDGAPLFGIIARNSAPIDIDFAVKSLLRPGQQIEFQEQDGVSLFVATRENACVCFINDSTLIVGHVDFVKKMIAARNQFVPDSVLTTNLAAMGNQLLVAAVDGREIEDSVKNLFEQVPIPISLFSTYFIGAKELSLAVDLNASELLLVKLEFKKPELAVGLSGILEQQLATVKEQFPTMTESLRSDEVGALLLPYTEQIIEGAKLTRNESQLTFAVPQLKDLDKLPEQLAPVVAKSNELVQKTQNLRQIGLAFHIYHDNFKCFPALNGPGDKNAPHPGLSWRVAILPFLDQAQLYNQFHLDEPWDSEHNKSLIAQMPKVFGTNPEGKTTLHLITGDVAPFQNDQGLRIRDVTDGTSNTIMAVDAGANVAEIWTKPGGLTFDPHEPLKCLGEIQEFSVVMIDGATRRFKNLDPEVFRKLVQHNDGLPVMIP